MNDFHRMRDVRGVPVVHGDNESSPDVSGVLEMRAQLDEEQARLLVMRLPISELGKASNFLQQLHYFHFGVHTLRSEEHTSELQSHLNLVCRLLLEKKNSLAQ